MTLKRDSHELFTCSVIGARGYSGLELVKLLIKHPFMRLTHCFATGEFKLPFKNINNIHCLPNSDIFMHKTDYAFLATPAEVSLELAPKLIAQGTKVIDLSGAFRLKESDYEKWYGFKHTETDLLQKATYGLIPFVGPFQNNEMLIANPGCYATAIEMALIPILKLLKGPIVIDAKSGATGAGKKAAENLLFTEVDGECLPYKIGKHQHLPEIIETCKQFTGISLNTHFSTSLLPVRRGIIAAIYAETSASEQEIEQAYQNAFAHYDLVEFGKSNPDLLSLKKVIGTGKINISYTLVDGKLYLYSVIDNLMKGAATQAIENLNRLLDCPTSTGLTHLETLI